MARAYGMRNLNNCFVFTSYRVIIPSYTCVLGWRKGKTSLGSIKKGSYLYEVMGKLFFEGPLVPTGHINVCLQYRGRLVNRSPSRVTMRNYNYLRLHLLYLRLGM